MQVSFPDCYHTMQAFFSGRKASSFIKLCKQIDQVDIEQPDVFRKIFEQFFSAPVQEIVIATKALKMVEAVVVFQGVKPESMAMIVKICIAAAAFLKKHKYDDELVLFHKNESRLPYSLLIDRVRNAATILYEKTILTRPQEIDSALHNAVELLVHDDDRFVDCRNVIQKLQKSVKKALTKYEMQFTLWYGNGLSAVFPLSKDEEVQPMMTMEAFDCDLSILLRRSHTLSPVQKVMIVRAIFEKLLTMHVDGAVHNDIKIFNILIRYRYGCTEISLCDFGHTLDKTKLSRNGGTFPLDYGTSLYAAPELWEFSIGASHQCIKCTLQEWRACDMFALGLVVYALIHDGDYLPFTEEALESAFEARRNIVTQLKGTQKLISEADKNTMKPHLWLYTSQIKRERKKLEQVFAGHTADAYTPNQLLAYIAWRLLDPDPSKRMTVQEGWDTLFASYWQQFSIDTLCFQLSKLQITAGR